MCSAPGVSFDARARFFVRKLCFIILAGWIAAAAFIRVFAIRVASRIFFSILAGVRWVAPTLFIGIAALAGHWAFDSFLGIVAIALRYTARSFVAIIASGGFSGSGIACLGIARRACLRALSAAQFGKYFLTRTTPGAMLCSACHIPLGARRRLLARLPGWIFRIAGRTRTRPTWILLVIILFIFPGAGKVIRISAHIRPRLSALLDR
jgi:hypothetical protein